MIDNPNDPSLRSFVPTTPDGPFPIQNLPFGVFRRPDRPSPRIGVAIGDHALDLAELANAGLLKVSSLPGDFFATQTDLGPLMSKGRSVWREVRQRVSMLLRHDTPMLRDDAGLRERALVPLGSVQMLLPTRIANYTDFYSFDAFQRLISNNKFH